MELGSVESGVEDLMDDLAEHICDLMVEYVKGLGMILWVLISGLRSTREGWQIREEREKRVMPLFFFLLQQTEHLHNTVALTISNQITWEREDRDDRPKKTGVIYNDISCLLHCFSITTNLQYLDSYI